MSDDLVKLRELAKQAIATDAISRAANGGPVDARVPLAQDALRAERDYRGAANPQAVIALLDRIEALQRLCGKAAEALADHYYAHPHINDEDVLAELREASK